MPDSHPWLHLQLQDQEKKKIVEIYDEVDILKNEAQTHVEYSDKTSSFEL